MNLVEYWKKRCGLAEAYIDETPCDHDIYKEFKKLPIHVVSKSFARCGRVKA